MRGAIGIIIMMIIISIMIMIIIIIIVKIIIISNRGCAPEPATEPDSVTRRPANEAR